ncbi:lysylphosphatidylglycerol synthase domain-containing protein [Georgenia sp. AZ-5]|uniref:lysylphosphatidylglycerol synthase domain-containing protein n=1 Tax=Georgenia sp. AZ-5 TaxID=3367526 RepID=UPI0037542933
MTQHVGESGATVPADAPREEASPRREVLLVDTPQTRVRRPADLLALVLSVLGIVFVLILAVYANATTQGVTEDVRSAVADWLRQVLLLPVTVLEGIVTFFVPIVVLVDRLVRRNWRSAVEAAITACVAGLLVVAALWLLDNVAPRALANGLAITTEGRTVIALNPYVAALSGLLTVVGDRSHNRLLSFSWGLLWVVLGLAIVQGEQTLPGALVTVLLGRAAGLGMRYASGVLHERAIGVSLVRGLRRAGLDPVRVVRADPLLPGSAVQAWTVSTSSPMGYTERLREPSALPEAGRQIAAEHTGERPRNHGGRPPQPASPAALLAAVDQEGAGGGDTIAPDPLTDPREVLAEVSSPAAGEEESEHRLYAVWDADGRRRDVTVLDGDRHVVGYLTSLWDSLRLRGLDQRPARTLREAANRAALLSLATRAAHVRTPALVGVTEARDSVLIVSEHLAGARRLDELAEDEIDERLCDEIWSQVRAAHAAGIAHRDLHAGSVLVDPDRRVWLVNWENGEIISSELARRIDLAQLLAMLGVLVGADRALASAARVLTRDQLASMAPLLQPVVLPAATRAAARNGKLLATLRENLIELIPTADVEPLQISRFSPRTVVTVTLAVVAAWVLMSSLNFREVADAVTGANPALMVLAFAMGLLTFVGAAVALSAFSPERLGLWRTTLVQVAASVVSLVAPAGIGPAALNLRFLSKRRISTPLAVATVGLVQVSQFVTTVLLLVVVALVTGSVGTLSAPSAPVTGAVLGGVGLVAVALLVPRVRSWAWAKAAPTLQQVWPRLVQVASSPRRLLAGILGNFLVTAGYITAFGASLAAFGYELPLTSLAITYLASNSIGSVVPSPGGIGPVEIALTGGLTVAGIPYATALSVAILFRLLTFWGRVPLGWAALRYLQRADVI